MNEPEKFLHPKFVPDEMAKRFGLTVPVRRVLEIRLYLRSRPEENFFIEGDCRPSDLFSWMKRNPNFRRGLIEKKKETAA